PCMAAGLKMSLTYSKCTFFFSSRRRHTRFSRDWSSDVCSSDLPSILALTVYLEFVGVGSASFSSQAEKVSVAPNRKQAIAPCKRSEERRVGKECRSWWSP